MENKHIAYYVTAHGYGHGVRSCDIIRAVNQCYPEIPVRLTTDLPRPFLRNRLDPSHTVYRAGSYDVGMVQLDSVRVDVDATLQRVLALYDREDELLDKEVQFLKEADIGLVVADIPALPLKAASLCGIPSVAIGNFSWDWIYSEFLERDERWKGCVDKLVEGYRCADMLLRLPFAGDMSVFKQVEDVPLVADAGHDRRAEIAAELGCDVDKTWVLLSFTTLDWDVSALDRVEALSEYEFFTVLPLEWKRSNIHPVPRDQFSFADVIASVDVVVTKPGFGILSECIANGKPMVYVDRTDFAEYPVLEAGLKRYLKHVHVSAERLYAGDLGEALAAVSDAAEPKESLEYGGAGVVAQRLVEMMRGS